MDDKVQKKLTELLVLYKKKLPEKLAEIGLLWQSILKDWTKEKLQSLHREIHSLCGSAGTYGYMDLSKIARNAEVFFKKLLPAEHLNDRVIKQGSKLIKELINFSINPRPSSEAILEKETPPENRLVYILEKSKEIQQQLNQNLRSMGFSPYQMQDGITLETALHEKPPIAMIVNTDFLDEYTSSFLKNRQNPNVPIQLFCIIPNAELYPRILAVRANCDAFFQLPIDFNYFTQIFHSKCSNSTEAYRVLIVEDSETLAEYYSLILNEAGLIATAITNPMKLLESVESFRPHLLIMDIYMPGCTGLELAAVLRQEPSYTKIPIIFLSTEEDKNKQFTISLGGDDFLAKPVSPTHLISAIRSRAKRASVLNYFMTTDSLTGLLNHSSALNQLEIEIIRARQKMTPLTVVMVDIDHFKSVNDQFGHPEGDEVLKHLANLFLLYLRQQDIVGRYGGEEFILILPGTGTKDAKLLCDELREQFSQFIFNVQETEFSTTFSAGLSSLSKDTSSRELILAADQALYQAKNLGRNRVEISKECKLN
jgi:diguanylate cyclase (GGDEF)-like protein